MDESLGEICWRLCGPIIRNYVQQFESAEKEWEGEICRNIYFTYDYDFVSKLPSHELRIFFWLDKIQNLNETQLLQALIHLQSNYVVYNFWRMPPHILSREETDLFYILHLLIANGNFSHAIPFLAKCLDFYVILR